MNSVKLALDILEIWYRPMYGYNGRQYLRFKTMGLIHHDRCLVLYDGLLK